MSDIKKRVLVVDDEPDIGLTLKIILERYGFTVDSFAVPKIALENFKPGLYDLIILDIKMPEISGFELYGKFKSKDANFKALFLTGLKELDDYDNLKKNVFPKMGERHFIQKPVSEKDLLEQVYTILN
jgi:two-component system response regulator ChvI